MDGEGGGGNARVDCNKEGQTSTHDMREDPAPTEKQKDDPKDDKAEEGGGQSKRKRQNKSTDPPSGAEKESRTKGDEEEDEASGDDDNADFMAANDEEPIEPFCKAITPTITAYKKFEPLYSALRALVAANDAPAPAGEERAGKWSAALKIQGNVHYLPPHILMSGATWTKVLDTNPIGMWFGMNKEDSSLIRVIKFYWKSQAPAVLMKKIVIEYQELLFKQNAPRGKLKNLWMVRTPQGIFTEEHGAVGEKKKWQLPMTAPFLSIDGKPLALSNTNRIRTPGKYIGLPTDVETMHSRRRNQVRGVRSRHQQEIIPRASQHQRSSNRKDEHMHKTRARGGISLQQACSTIINETNKRLARATKYAWGNAAYIETQQIHSLRWAGRLVRGRWRSKSLITYVAGVKWEGVALTVGKSRGGRGGEPKTGSKDRYKRRREEGEKGEESTGQAEKRGVENREGSMNDDASTSPENPSNSTQNKSNKKQKQSASTPVPTPPSRMIRMVS